MSGWWTPILIAATGLVLSALYSGMETGLYTINRVRLTVLAEGGDRRAQRLRRLLQRPATMLATLLIGNNIANYLGTFGVALALDRAGYSPLRVIIFNACILVPLLFVVGETLPKDLFRTFTDRWSYATSGVLRMSELVLTIVGLVPLVRAFGDMIAGPMGIRTGSSDGARQRMSQLIKEGVGPGVLSESQTTLIDRALAMRDRGVVDEMTPWSQVVWLDASATRDTVRDLLRRRRMTRAPVMRDRHVVGVLSLLEALLWPDEPLEVLCQPVLTFTRDTSVQEALLSMRRQRATLAVVLEDDNVTPSGIVTLKDLVEPLTGELPAW